MKIFSAKICFWAEFGKTAKYLTLEIFRLYGKPLIRASYTSGFVGHSIKHVEICPPTNNQTLILYYKCSNIPMFYCSIAAGCRNSANMEQYHQMFPQIDNQRTSALGEHSAPTFYPTQFNESTTISTGHCMPPHVGRSLPPSTSSQWILPSPQQHTLPGPFRVDVSSQLG